MIRNVVHVITGLVVFLGFCHWTEVNGLTCLSCDRANSINECLTWTADCKDNEEECFLDKTILPDSSYVLTGGCRAKLICDLIASASGKRSVNKRDNVACAACCNTPPANGTGIPCNAHLCNQSISLTCLSCDRASNINECFKQTATCKANEEECFLDKTILPDLSHVFTAGCRAKLICDLISSAAGKRSVSKRDNVACAECCNTGPTTGQGIPCNAHLCNQNISLTCLSCDSASSINECLKHTTTCKANVEECFLDKTILPDLSPVFTAGCRAKRICDLILSTVGKRSVNKRDNVACAECCNTGSTIGTGIPCNGHLCNQKPTISYSCAVCNGTDYNSCTQYRLCATDENCQITVRVIGGQLHYELGCAQKTQCDATLRAYKNSHQRWSTLICQACCTRDHCNKDDCFGLIKRQQCNDHSVCGQ